MRYGSVCSGIEAATVAWHPLGWRPSFFSEIEAFPRAVLAHHYPAVPLHGDFTTIKAGEYEPIDLLVGGTPCQSFSVAGLRGGLDDERGNLALEYLRLADRLRPRWLVWENVPGVLSSNGGRDFGAILGGMVELGYGFAYRVLDAQFFGLAQRRKRVFVVGYLGDWRRAAAVLFERHSLSGHPAPSRKAGQRVAPTIAGCSNGGGANGPGRDAESAERLIPIPHAPISPDGSHANGGGQLAVAFAQNQRDEVRTMDVAGSLAAEPGAKQQTYIAFHNRQDPDISGDVTHPLGAQDNGMGLQHGMQVRRFTPRECERLQGFPDDYTLIPYRGKPADQCPDGPRYKALGNSWAVPCARWIGERIAAVDELQFQTMREAA